MTNETNNANKKFAIVNIFAKDVSFESPNSPHMFTAEWKPKIDFDIQMGSNPIDKNLYEAVLHLTVTTSIEVPENFKDQKAADAAAAKEGKLVDKTAFIVEVKQGGIFAIEGFTKEEVEHILGTSAQEILFPYAREIVSSMVGKGGYPQLLLPPVNFEVLYQDHKNKINAKATAANDEPVKEKS